MAFVMGKVVVGVDDSPASLRALWVAIEQARQRYVPVHVVHVGGNVGFSTRDNTPIASLTRSDSAHQSRGRRIVEDALVELFGEVPADVPICLRLSAPPIGPALVRAVSEPDLLIVGRSRHGLVGRLLLGSVSAYCVAHAPCPVVCVPGPEPPRRSYATSGRRNKIVWKGSGIPPEAAPR